MAVKDVKRYYYSILGQYVEMKESLKDFQEAFEAGHFTEDQLEDIKANIAALEENYNRISYIMYLLEMPARKEKQAKYKKSNNKLEEYFKITDSATENIVSENNSLLDNIRKELKKLTKEVPISTKIKLEDLLKDEEEK